MFCFCKVSARESFSLLQESASDKEREVKLKVKEEM